MTAIPITRSSIAPERQQLIRQSVRSAAAIMTEADNSRLAQADDAHIFHAFLSDPDIHAPIYTLPRPLNVDAVRAFIADHLAQRERGEGLLFLNFDASGAISGYVDIVIWPQWAAGELGGAVGKARQGQRRGIEGARRGFDWMFDVLGLDLICETAALDNIRTAKLLDGLGFRRRGEILSEREDGTTRPSLVWEVTRSEWDAYHRR
ncbi:GNAT family N-acetyltransferase [Parasphingorhabdus sp.]|jgi:RimJ/RimL family protein N-acetyltransferase|uniref:GNAT family N-acetyltransferase n=1 Tax=Parasphingorhabdus sp. TaxID=2709688 RepID=UPI003D299978